jgi:hypothetical protein
MKTRLGKWVRQTCQYLLDQSINLYPQEQRSWGRAASAEVHIMPSSFSAVCWTHGALWVALRAGLGRLLRRPADAFLGANTLLRRSWPSLSPLVLALSLCFFLAPQFRQALQATTSMWVAADPMPGLSQRTFHKLEAKAEREHDAPTLAFLAFHAKDRKDTIRLAGEAVALDSGLTWILGQIRVWGRERSPAQWTEQLEQWDPDNAIPYLLHADSLVESAMIAEKKDQVTILDEMRAADSPFRQLMRRAFAASRYDSYLPRRMELERNVQRKHDLARPLLLLEAFQRSRLPSFFHAQTYAQWIIADAKTTPAGAALRSEDTYRQVFRFGQLIEAHSRTLAEQSTGGTFQQLGSTELIPLLRAQGRTEEAATLVFALERVKQYQQRDTLLEGALLDSPFAPIYRPHVFSPGIIIHLAALGFILALVLLAASLLSFRFRSANDAAAIALPWFISYAPLLLFSSALLLLVTYLPYARIYGMYVTGQEMANGLMIGPLRDPRLLASLSNLQSPFLFLSGTGIHWTLSIALLSACALGLYGVWRMRTTPTHA